MKKIFIFILIIIGITACENMKQEWPDFDLKAVYFPYQTPIRILSFGEDRIDNSLDKKFEFDISVTIGGMYENKKDWTVDYIIDNDLLSDSVLGNENLQLFQLPANYYELSPLNTIIIPKGSFSGRLRVKLTNPDQFLNDSLALTGQYVIPVRLTGTSADSILMGEPKTDNPDRRINSDWTSSLEPKDWVLFGIKYVNAYNGTWLQRGRIIKFSGTTPLDTIVYRSLHRERDIVVSLATLSKTKSITNFIANQNSDDGSLAMELEFANMWGTPGGSITISPRDGALYEVTGSGQYFDKANSVESWIGLIWPSMHLNYSYNDGTNTYQVTDTLVFRDRGLKIELHNLTIIK